LAAPARRIAPTGSRGHTYSARRFRIVVTLLTLVTLPVVIGTSVLIYYYLRYSVMIDRRLHGERWLVPARLYARPLTLRTGMPFTSDGLVNVLNGLKYDQTAGSPGAPGQFVAGQSLVAFYPRPMKGTPDEPLAVLLEKPKPPKDKAAPLEPERIKEIRGLQTKRAYPNVTLEPELITYLFDADTREKRRVIKYEELPQHLVESVLAIEDRRFFSHPGLDPFRILGAAVRNMQAESYIQGGSTITQQLVKNFFLTPDRTMRRKLQEALLAFVLERRAAKKEILELYLNEVYLGQIGSFSIHGLGQAARMYFHKDVANLTVSESALLAGMIQSPNPYNPYRHPQRATERRNLVLNAMGEAGFLEKTEVKAAQTQPLGVERPSVDTAEAPYFVDLVKAQLAQRYDSRVLETQNLSIYTSLDPSLQALGQQVLSEGLARAEKMIRRRKSKAPLQGALIAMEPRTGAVLALVGGRSYGDSQYNRATLARRQPGSTFKPFVYLSAFEATFDDPNLPPITPATVVEDAPTVFLYEDKEYMPQNYEDEYHGYVTLRQAMAHSLNAATVKVAEMVGYDKVATLWNKKMGMPGQVQPYPAVALGSFEATPLELATAYNVLANMGLKVEPVTVLSVADEKQKTLEQHSAKPPRVVRPETAFLVVHMMRSVLLNGTAAGAWAMGLPRGIDVAGKTGTTNDLRDAWFVGFTPDLLCVVWVGYDDNSPVYLSGAKAALPIWVDFMKGALAGVTPSRFQVPASNIIFEDIDPTTGLRSTPSCPKTFAEAFIAGTEPQEYCSWHDGSTTEPPDWQPYRPSPTPSPSH
jgi:penicillin-binding protein 1B